MTNRDALGRYATVASVSVGKSDKTAARSERDRGRKRREAASMKIGHVIPGHHGHGARQRKEAAIAVTVVKRRCPECEQIRETKVADEQCPYCDEVFGVLK